MRKWHMQKGRDSGGDDGSHLGDELLYHLKFFPVLYPFTLIRLPWWLIGKESAFSVGEPASIPGLEDPLEKGLATHFSILA